MDPRGDRTELQGKTRILTAICASAVVIPIVFTGPAISISAVGLDLGGDLSSLGWMVNGYAITFGGTVMVAGTLADRIGRKCCFIAGLVIFAATSVLIALTPSLLLLNLLRAVEGVGGALCASAAMAMLAQEYQGDARSLVFSIFGTSIGAGLAFGPLSAGFLIDIAGWRSFYLAIAVVSVMILVFGRTAMRESRDPSARGIDWPGAILFTAGLLALTAGLVLGPVAGWTSVEVLSLLMGALGFIITFIAVEQCSKNPMLDLSLFRYPRFIGVQVLAVATAFSFIAPVIYLPTWFITIQRADEITTGLSILPLTAPMLIVPLVAGRLAKSISPSLISAAGFLLSAVGLILLMRMSPDTGIGPMILPMLLIGIGNGLPWGLMDALAVSVVPTEQAGMAAGIFGTMRVAGESIAIAAVGAALIGLTAYHLTSWAADQQVDLPANAAELAAQFGSGAQATSSTTVSDVQLEVIIKSAYHYAFQVVLVVLAAIAAAAAIICLITLKKSIDTRMPR